MRNWLCSGVLVLAAVAAGCGGGGGAKPVTTDDFCDQKAEKECATPAGNCGVTKTKCEDARKALCTAWVADIRANSTTRSFKAANITTCLNQTAAAYAAVLVKPAGLDAMEDACQLVFQGGAAKGEKCTTKYDCMQSSMICDKAKCATKVARGMGEGCSDPGEVCAAGAFCSKDDTGAYTCLAKRKMGEACDADTNPCLEALRCAAGTCAERAMSGEMCMVNDDCATAVPYCDKTFTPPKCDTGLTLGGGSPACAQFGGT